MSQQVASAEKRRGGFSSRKVFVFAAIGSAVGLGNIWRFPYVAYENGGGSFMIPYLTALLVAGIPFLFFDYAIGHITRGSSPLAMRRLGKRNEFIGWWHVIICFVIAVYYAAILAWAAQFTIFSFTKKWGDDPEAFMFGEFLKTADANAGVTFEFVPAVLIPMVLVWLAVIVVMTLGVQKGIGATAVIFIPLLVVAFVWLVIQSLFLPGAVDGINALFTPEWSKLADPTVWTAAVGQIFFSLSVGFAIMITYASYVKRKTDMTGSGLVVGFANSGFELLAGIGVFAALGFLATAQNVAVGDVATSGLVLAFVAFPTILNEAPMGELLGVLFFGSLFIAGVTSLISIVEVVISAFRDKFELGRVQATLLVTIPIALVSIILLSTTSGLNVLDIADRFINQYGIVLAAVVSIIALGWFGRKLPMFAKHLSQYGSFKLGRVWVAIVAFVLPIALIALLLQSFLIEISAPYAGYPQWLINIFGWGVAAGAIVLGFLLSLMPWNKAVSLELPEPAHTAANRTLRETKQEQS